MKGLLLGLVKNTAYQGQVFWNQLPLAPFDFKSKQFLGSPAHVETERFKRRPHLVGVLAWLSFNPCAGNTTAVWTGADKTEAHAAQ